MRITACRRQYLSDHSSTNYLFYSLKSLSKESQAFVNTLSSHVAVTSRTAEITYHGDFADLGHDRRLKFLEHFPVNVRESYDWWDMVIALDKAKVANLDLPNQYKECQDESSLSFSEQDKALILWFEGVHLDCGALKGMKDLADLCLDIRNEVHRGRLDALDVMANYCVGKPELADRKLSPAAQGLTRILEPIGRAETMRRDSPLTVRSRSFFRVWMKRIFDSKGCRDAQQVNVSVLSNRTATSIPARIFAGVNSGLAMLPEHRFRISGICFWRYQIGVGATS